MQYIALHVRLRGPIAHDLYYIPALYYVYSNILYGLHVYVYGVCTYTQLVMSHKYMYVCIRFNFHQVKL
jgi:hypothetical protein